MRRISKIVVSSLIATLAGGAVLIGCAQGNTDGGGSKDDAGPGTQLVSDGGFGASLVIDIVKEPIPTGGVVGFFVTAKDPRGEPLGNRRVFCESEHGIAIVEPSNGGVAFEHTEPNGRFSGKLGGLAQGSWMMECRLEEGFNVRTRKHTKVVGPTPAGFIGFPGAAGGNLGGGVLADITGQLGVSSITFKTVSGSTTQIDTNRISDCVLTDQPTVTPEPFTSDYFSLTVKNPDTSNAIKVNTITYEVDLGGGNVVTCTQPVNQTIGSTSSSTVSGFFTTALTNSTKVFAGTNTTVPPVGLVNVNFTVKGESLNGVPFTVEGSTGVELQNLNVCTG